LREVTKDKMKVIDNLEIVLILKNVSTLINDWLSFRMQWGGVGKE
jgi:hypothetical protein